MSTYNVVVSDRGFEKFRLAYRHVLPAYAASAQVFSVEYVPCGYLARVVKLFHLLANGVCRDILNLPEMVHFVDAAAEL